MSLTKYLRNTLLPISLGEVRSDPLLARCMDKIFDLESLSAGDQRHVCRVVMDKGIRFGELNLIPCTLERIAENPENAFHTYVAWKKLSTSMRRPMDVEGVIAREYLALKPVEQVAAYCATSEHKMAFADIFGAEQATKLFGRGYEHSVSLEM